MKHVYDLSATVDPATVTRAEVEANAVRCPDAATAEKMIRAIEQARATAIR